MKNESNFWLSLERYSWKVVRRNPLPWRWVVLGVVAIVFLVSALNVKNSLVEARSSKEAIEIAISLGDYETAQELFNRKSQIINSQMVLGVDSELEDKVYPEKVVERRIADLEGKLELYPGNREIYLRLVTLLEQLEETRVDTEVDPYKDKADQYREKARILDPNGVEF